MRPIPDATALADAIANRMTTARDTLERTLAEIATRNRALNAIVVMDTDRARMAADTADRAVRAGHRAPLLGVPVTIKESFDVAGLPTSWGLEVYRDAVANDDAVAVERLRAAGAVIVGKTNVSEGLAGWNAENPIYGRTNHPLNHDWTPGGSSSGAAVAVAVGLSALDIGSDLGGSIRGPAHFCGVYGHMATHGIIPLRGHALEGRVARLDLSSPGPMARSARDLMVGLDVMAGPDSDEASAFRLALPPPRHSSIEAYRVLVLDRHPLVPTSAVVRNAVRHFADRLASAGVKVEDAQGIVPDVGALTETYLALLGTALALGQTQSDVQAVREKLRGIVPDERSIGVQRLRAAVMSHADWVRANEMRARLRWAWKSVFDRFDVVLCPPAMVAAPDHKDAAAETLDVDGVETSAVDNLGWAAIASCCGLPATTFPVTRTPEGKPLGVQVIGPYLEDRTPIAFAELAGALP